jgi:hypothetical protein
MSADTTTRDDEPTEYDDHRRRSTGGSADLDECPLCGDAVEGDLPPHLRYHCPRGGGRA